MKLLWKRKYFFMSCLFIIWISFFDSNSLLMYYQYNKIYNQMLLHQSYLKKKIAKEKYLTKKIFDNIRQKSSSSHINK